MTNEKKAREIAEKTHTVWRDEEGEDISSQDDCYDSAMAMASFKDTQSISELGGWQTEPPTENGLYLGDKGFVDEDSYRYIVVYWYCSLKKFCLPSKVFYQKIKRWKKI